MLKYVDSPVTFAEIPDEVTLCISISGCPLHCEGCHSSYLAEDIGTPLDCKELHKLIDKNKGITCVCFMGHGNNTSEVCVLAADIRANYPTLKIALYTGLDELPDGIKINLNLWDFIKIGHYDKEKGGLASKTTNQRFYKIEDNKMIDITSRFFK